MNVMERKRMNHLNVEPSLLGYGCMRFPCLENGEIDEKKAEALLDTAIKHGVNYIDTAYPYHETKSEPFVGKVLQKYPRNSFYLATKLPLWDIQTKAEAIAIFESQLQRLQVTYVDFYLLHAMDLEKWEKVLSLDILPYLEEQQKIGRIRFLGFSFHDSYEVFERMLSYRDWDFCQLQLNYMDMNVQAGFRGYRLAEELEVPIIVMEPVKGGSLANLPDDIRKMLQSMHPDASPSSWALRFVASLANVKVVLSGMSNEDQLFDNIHTFSPFISLDKVEQETIQQVAMAIHERMRNGCTGCAYCMPCPFGVDIPGNFKLWNDDAMYGNHEKALRNYEHMNKQQATYCQACGACEKQCPQHIQIREDLQKIMDEYSCKIDIS